MNNTWDAAEYESGFSFVHRYGTDVLDLIDAQPGSRVVDLGCGNGALTAQIAERGFSVQGIDASAEMIEAARLAHPNLPFFQADACTFKLDQPADAIFSNAVFHWIDDERQDALLINIARNLVPGGELVCEFGGFGCAERVHRALGRAFRRRGLDYQSGFYFPTIGEYAPRLEAAGLLPDFAVLFDRPTRQEGPDGLRRWIRMFVQHPFEGMDAATVDELIDEAVEELRPMLLRDDGWYVDYVRIRLRARRL